MKIQIIFTLILSIFLGVMGPAHTVGQDTEPNQSVAGYTYLTNGVSPTPNSSSQSPTDTTVTGNHYPYSLTYDTAVWDRHYGQSGNHVEYKFVKKHGHAKVFVDWFDDRVHYTEVVGMLKDALMSAGLENVDIPSLELYENNDHYYLYCQFTGDTHHGVTWVGYVFHYPTSQGMFRIAFVTKQSEQGNHMDDFEHFFKGLYLND